MIDLIEKMGDSIQTFDAYRKLYAGSSDYTPYNERYASAERVLREWDTSKQDLYQLLGNELIISKPVIVDKPKEKMRNELYRLTDKYYHIRNDLRDYVEKTIAQPYANAICDCRYDETGWVKQEWTDAYNEIYNPWQNTIFSLLGVPILMENKNDRPTCTLYLNKEKTESIVVPQGCKPIKMLRKIAKALNMPQSYMNNFEEFRLEHSRICNDKHIEGELCLSIHPMDYMTMSDNRSSWTSCMAWSDHTGEYRAGTIEMMNSPNVLVAYLRHKDDNNDQFKFDLDQAWNNKQWRILAVIDKEGYATTIKGYPYQHNALEEIIADWLVELAFTNWHVNFTNRAYTTDSALPIGKFPNITFTDGVVGTGYIKLSLYSNLMYNDFGTRSEGSDKGHIILSTDDLLDDFAASNTFYHYSYNTDTDDDGHPYALVHVDRTYSGEWTCIWCGGYDIGDGEESQDRVCCFGCAEEYGLYCSNCGERIYDESDAIYDENGDVYCEYCANDLLAYDQFNHVWIYQEDSVNIYLATCKDIPLIHEDAYITTNINDLDALNDSIYFNCAPRTVSYNYDTIYYYNLDDLTPRGMVGTDLGTFLSWSHSPSAKLASIIRFASQYNNTEYLNLNTVSTYSERDLRLIIKQAYYHELGYYNILRYSKDMWKNLWINVCKGDEELFPSDSSDIEFVADICKLAGISCIEPISDTFYYALDNLRRSIDKEGYHIEREFNNETLSKWHEIELSAKNGFATLKDMQGITIDLGAIHLDPIELNSIYNTTTDSQVFMNMNTNNTLTFDGTLSNAEMWNVLTTSTSN